MRSSRMIQLQHPPWRCTEPLTTAEEPPRLDDGLAEDESDDVRASELGVYCAAEPLVRRLRQDRHSQRPGVVVGGPWPAKPSLFSYHA